MAATATASSAGPRYAPVDPTLPKPWRGLVDGKTGYLYFWNPETNVTQYQRPVAPSSAGSAPSQESPSVSTSLSVQLPESSQAQSSDNNSVDGVNNDGSKLASGANGGQSAIARSDYSQIDRSSAVGSGDLSAEAYCRRHEISVTGGNVPPPFISFVATGLPSEILREVQNAGFSAPTPIQAQSWPIALQNRDIVAIAKTGSGKTLGYLIPSFVHLKQRRNNPQLGPTILVLSPTRELATQIQDEAVKFGKSSRIAITCLYGGAPKGPQLRELDRGADIVVATPGRLNDILEMRRVSLSQVSYLVLDEADRMLDMGFEPQIRKIVKEVPARRQTLMYTATWPKEVRKIAADLLVNPVQVNIGNVDELVANKSITQHVEIVPYMEKQRRVEQIVRSQEPGSKIIIFCSTKKMCDMLSRNLSRQFGASAIHGDKSQDERDNVLSQFRTGRTPVLVATDVAARGLDVKDIRVVINYDFPTGIEDYVHRIGRTGRAGATGMAYTFFGDQDAKHASDLVKILEGANQQVPDEIRDMASRGGGMGRFSRPRWGSSGSGGRDGGGRGGGQYDSGYGSTPSSDRGGYSFDRESRDRYDSNAREGNGGDAPVSFHNRSFHESMYGGGEKRTRSKSPSPIRSPKRVSGWGSQQNSFNEDRGPPRSFHELMMEKAKSAPPPQNQLSSSTNGDNTKEAGNLQSPVDEEGAVRQDKEGVFAGAN